MLFVYNLTGPMLDISKSDVDKINLRHYGKSEGSKIIYKNNTIWDCSLLINSQLKVNETIMFDYRMIKFLVRKGFDGLFCDISRFPATVRKWVRDLNVGYVSHKTQLVKSTSENISLTEDDVGKKIEKLHLS